MLFNTFAIAAKCGVHLHCHVLRMTLSCLLSLLLLPVLQGSMPSEVPVVLAPCIGHCCCL